MSPSLGWSDDRVATLSKLWLEGLSASQIAKQLGGVTRNAVIGKVHRFGLSGRGAPSAPTRNPPGDGRLHGLVQCGAARRPRPERLGRGLAIRARGGRLSRSVGSTGRVGGLAPGRG
ncbi:MAG: GcrA family cell cycle regulator, partial [Caulobacteraceae bacterium]